MSEVDKSLPFNEEFQEALVGHCLQNQDFFIKCYNKLKAEWFTRNILVGAIYSQLCTFYKLHDSFIQSVQEFKNFDFFLYQMPEERDKYYALLERCLLSSRNFDITKIQKQLTGFLRESLFKESIQGAAQRYKSQGFVETYEWTAQHLSAIRDATFEDDNDILSFDYPELWIAKQQDRRTNAISTGSNNLDEALGGGLFRKEACAIMAASNVGKTTCFITIARHAVLQGHNVLFLVHEGDPEEIRLRILCSFLGINIQTIFQWIKDTEKKLTIKRASAFLKKHLTFVPYIRTNAMYVEDVMTFIKKMNQEKKNKTGKGFDLIIDDYPKKLRSKLRSGTKEGLYRIEAAEIYESFCHLATEIDVHCLVAVQTNRTGLKQNNLKLESDFLLGMEEIDEAYGIAQNMPNIITLNRSPDDRKSEIIRINIAKSRNAITDVAVNSRTKYDCFTIFGDKKMFWNKETDISGGFLASEIQPTNARQSTDTINESLRAIEDNRPKGTDQIGAYSANGKLS